ncbi:hypothetical protein Pmani_009185 [Petrolisthes manimaculis]|uniref:Uncharacterized protein n=1 Tax=Petrolisthes manimaculis TaxID=1843537 RepID=A0AAE1UI63_9EUCA|nr:hypothetical protein Pmani_009185 [Petrolisthes manimaculis]
MIGRGLEERSWGRAGGQYPPQQAIRGDAYRWWAGRCGGRQAWAGEGSVGGQPRGGGGKLKEGSWKKSKVGQVGGQFLEWGEAKEGNQKNSRDKSRWDQSLSGREICKRRELEKEQRRAVGDERRLAIEARGGGTWWFKREKARVAKGPMKELGKKSRKSSW